MKEIWHCIIKANANLYLINKELKTTSYDEYG